MSFYWEFNGFWGLLLLRHTMILKPSKTSAKVELASQRKVLLKNSSGKNDVLLSIPTDAVFFLTWQGFWTSKRDRLGVPWIQRFWTLALYGHTPRNKNLTSDCLLKSQQFYKIIINNQLSKDFKSKVLKTTFVQVILRKNLIKVQVTPHWWPWFWPF